MAASRAFLLAIVWFLVSGATFEAPAQEEVRIVSGRDNTLYESSTGALSNGAGQYLFVGRTQQAQGSIRRALVWFDLSEIPQGASIESAELELSMSMTVAGEVPITLHRVTASWGEGASQATGQEGGGGASANGDATWIHRSFPETMWENPGGDFVQAASGSASVGGSERYSWSSAGMVEDVQDWLDDPDSNHGWLLQGNEATAPSAKRFNSRHHVNADSRPVLVVTFSSPIATEPVASEGGFHLGTAYPNPVPQQNGFVRVPFRLERPEEIRLEVFDLLGRRVALLVDAHLPAGEHAAEWPLLEANGRGVSPGIYIIRLAAPTAIRTNNVVVLD